MAPIREIRTGSVERLSRSAEVPIENEDGEISSVKDLQDDVRYTNEKYPEILTNFKIHNRVLKMQESRNLETNHKREEGNKRSNAKNNGSSGNKIIKKRNAVDEEPETIEEIEDSLKHIITQLGLSPDDKTFVNKRAASNAFLNELQGVNEDEDLEAGANKIDIHKESHESTSGRTKKEGKRKNKKKSPKPSKQAEDKDEEEEEDEEDDNYKRSAEPSEEDSAVTNAPNKENKEVEVSSSAMKRSNKEQQLKSSKQEDEEETVKTKEDAAKAKEEENEEESIQVKRSNGQGRNAHETASHSSKEEKVVKEDQTNMKRSNKEEEAAKNLTEKEEAAVKRSSKEDEIVLLNYDKEPLMVKRSSKDESKKNQKIANYQKSGEAYLRNKRQSVSSTESTDIVKGLETSGELTVSGNKNPLASSNEEDVTKAKVIKKSSNEEEKKEYDLDLEKNIQKQIQAIKEQVKREIEALKTKEVKDNATNRKKRTARNTLMDEEENFLNPNIYVDSMKPHIRSKRDFDNELSDHCPTEKSIIKKRYVNIVPRSELSGTNNVADESLNDFSKKMTRESKDTDDQSNLETKDVKHLNHKTRATEQQESNLLNKALANSLAESDAIYKNLKSRSNDNEPSSKNEQISGNVNEADTNQSKDAPLDSSNLAAITGNALNLQKRTIGFDNELQNKSGVVKQQADIVKRNSIQKDSEANLHNKIKRSKSEEEGIKQNVSVTSEVAIADHDRQKRKEGNEQISLYDVALKKRELSPSVKDLAGKTNQFAQLNPDINEESLVKSNDFEENLQKRNVDENTDEHNLVEDAQLVNAIDKRQAQTTTKPGIIQKRQSFSIYAPDNLKEDQDKIEGIKQKRHEKVQSDVKEDKRLRRNEMSTGNDLAQIDKNAIVITDSIDRSKRNKETPLEENLEKTIENQQKIETRKRRGQEIDKMSESTNELEMERKKRNDAGVKIKEKMRQMSKPMITQKRASDLVIHPYMISNEDDLRKRKRRHLQNEDRKIRSFHQPLSSKENERISKTERDNLKQEIKESDDKTRKKRHVKERTKRGSSRECKDSSKKTSSSKKVEKGAKARRDIDKHHNQKNKRKSRSNKVDVDPILIHQRRKRSNMLYYPYRDEEEEVDEEGDEFDVDGFADREENFLRKREVNGQQDDNMDEKGSIQQQESNRITKRNSLLHDYVSNMNSDAYENPNEDLYQESHYDRKKRQDLDDDFSMYNEEPNNRRSIKREVNLRNTRDRKIYEKLDDNMLGLSDSDLFGSLPQSYEGELSRFKRVKRTANDHT